MKNKLDKLIDIKVFKHNTKEVGKDKQPFLLYVIFREKENNQTKRLAFNNFDWLPEFTNIDNLNKNYTELKDYYDDKLKYIKLQTK